MVTGAGKYTDDVQPAGCLHAVFVRSPHAHARITARRRERGAGRARSRRRLPGGGPRIRIGDRPPATVRRGGQVRRRRDRGGGGGRRARRLSMRPPRWWSTTRCCRRSSTRPLRSSRARCSSIPTRATTSPSSSTWARRARWTAPTWSSGRRFVNQRLAAVPIEANAVVARARRRGRDPHVDVDPGAVWRARRGRRFARPA